MTRGAVLITGGAGYVGSHVAWAMIEAGREVVVLDDLSTGARALAPEQARRVVGCAGDEVRLRRVLDEHAIAAVLHIAGSADVQDSLADPAKYHRNNTLVTARLAQVAADAGLPLLFASTAAVYAPGSTARLREGDPTDPSSPYGASKLAAERALADIATQARSPWMVLRYFNVAGADPLGRCGPLRSGRLFEAACDVALGRRPALAIYGRRHPTPDGTCVRDYIHVSDLAEAHVQALRHLENGGASGVVNCGGGRGGSVLEVIAAVEAAAGRSISVTMQPPRPGDSPHAVCDDERLRKLLPQWRPRLASLEAMARTLLDWERRGTRRAA